MKSLEDRALIGVVIYEGVEPIDIGGTVGVVSMASRILPHITSIVIAEKAGPVRLAGHLTVMADVGFDDATACDVYIVCGGPGWKEQVVDAAMLGFLRSRPRHEFASVCTGAMILAAAGLLDGLRVTTRRSTVGREPASPLSMINQFAKGAKPLEGQIVEDQGVLTSGGVSLAIDGTLHLIGRLYGEEAMHAVAKAIEYDRAFAANRSAFGAT